MGADSDRSTDAAVSMEIVFQSPFFWPEEISTGRYNSYLVESLAARGCKVSVICLHPFYPDWRITKSMGKPPFDCSVYRGGENIRFPSKQVFRRLVLELSYLWHVSRIGRKLRSARIAAIVDVYPPNLFALLGWRRRRRKSAVIGVVHDLQGLMSQARPSLFRSLVGALIRPLEGATLRRADHLVFLSNGMKDYALANYGVDEKRCSVVYPFQTLPNESSETNPRIPSALSEGKKTLVYSGALGEKQAPEKLYELMNEFGKRNASFDVHIFSDGPVFEALKKRIGNTDNTVNFHGLVPKDELLGLLKRSTIQIVPQKLGLSHGAFPSKVPNLVAAETAIFGVTDEGSELHHILGMYSKGLASNSWDLDTNIQLLQSLADSESVSSPASNPLDDGLRKQFEVSALCDIIIKFSRMQRVR